MNSHRHWHQRVSQILVLFFIFQSGIVSAATKTALIPIPQEQDRDASLMLTLAQKIRERLKDRLTILPLAVSQQMLKNSQLAGVSVVTQKAVSQVDEILDRYYSYQASMTETIAKLEAVVTFIKDELPPASESSQLLVTARVTQSWLEFQSLDHGRAANCLERLFAINPQMNLELSYYPVAFRHFATEFQKRYQQNQPATLIVTSSPKAVSAYVDGIFVGTTPVLVTVAAGQRVLGLEATGRVPAERQLNLLPNQRKRIKVTLAWQNAEQKNPATALNERWGVITTADTVSLAAQVTRATQSDMAVFIQSDDVEKGQVPRAKVYNAQYSQMLKTISYPQTVVDLPNHLDAVADHLATQLAPYLENNSMSYWSKNIDRSVIVDHRVASRGKKPLTKKPLFWVGVGGVVAAGVIAGVLIANHADQAPATGGVTIGF